MRIISGTRKGRKLVDWEEEGIRPMRDFVRSALFNIISDLVPGARFLDLFCGTGSVGLEALSRGAQECVFIDSSKAACAITRRNLEKLRFLAQALVLPVDFRTGIDHVARRGRRFDLVFVGPPYGKGLAAAALTRLGMGDILAADAVVVAEVYKKEKIGTRYGVLSCIDRRDYGDNTLLFYAVSPVDRVGTKGELGQNEKTV